MYVLCSECDLMAAEMHLLCIIRTILIDELYCSISVICCDLELHMLHHSFQRLQSLLNPVADSALADSISSGGLDFITDRESICKQQKSLHIALTHGMRVPIWGWRHSLNRCTLVKIRGCGKIISVYKMHVNVPVCSLSLIQGSQLKWRLLAFWAFGKIWNSCKSTTARYSLVVDSNRDCN